MKKKHYFGIALAALACTACSGEERTIDNGTGEALSVSANIGDTEEGVSTRSIITSFSSSIVGVFVEGTGYSPASYSTCTVSASGTSLAPSPAIYINAEATVYGFYPVTDVSGSGDITLTSPTSASRIRVKILSADDFAASLQTDYLYAVADGTVDKSDHAVTLTFHHALSKLTFKVKKESSYGGTGTLTQIRLSTPAGGTNGYFLTGTTESGYGMAVNGGAIDGLSSSATTSLTFSGSQLLTTTSIAVAGVMVAPQTFPTDTRLYLTIDGEEYSVTLPTANATVWAAGTNYTYQLKVTGESLSVDGNVTINSWTPNTTGTETTVN